MPNILEVADGSSARQILELGSASFSFSWGHLSPLPFDNFSLFSKEYQDITNFLLRASNLDPIRNVSVFCISLMSFFLEEQAQADYTLVVTDTVLVELTVETGAQA